MHSPADRIQSLPDLPSESGEVRLSAFKSGGGQAPALQGEWAALIFRPAYRHQLLLVGFSNNPSSRDSVPLRDLLYRMPKSGWPSTPMSRRYTAPVSVSVTKRESSQKATFVGFLPDTGNSSITSPVGAITATALLP